MNKSEIIVLIVLWTFNSLALIIYGAISENSVMVSIGLLSIVVVALLSGKLIEI